MKLQGFSNKLIEEYRTKQEESISKDFENIKENLIKYIRKLTVEYPFEYQIKENFDVDDFLKVLNLKFDLDYYTELEEKLYAYIDIISYFNICKLLIIPNIKLYLDKIQLVEFYKYCKYKKVNILIIEKGIDEKVLKYEKKLIIDDTFDEFIINSID